MDTIPRATRELLVDRASAGSPSRCGSRSVPYSAHIPDPAPARRRCSCMAWLRRQHLGRQQFGILPSLGPLYSSILGVGIGGAGTPAIFLTEDFRRQSWSFLQERGRAPGGDPQRGVPGAFFVSSGDSPGGHWLHLIGWVPFWTRLTPGMLRGVVCNVFQTHHRRLPRRLRRFLVSLGTACGLGAPWNRSSPWCPPLPRVGLDHPLSAGPGERWLAMLVGIAMSSASLPRSTLAASPASFPRYRRGTRCTDARRRPLAITLP